MSPIATGSDGENDAEISGWLWARRNVSPSVRQALEVFVVTASDEDVQTPCHAQPPAKRASECAPAGDTANKSGVKAI
jgi:hypothetical protein